MGYKEIRNQQKGKKRQEFRRNEQIVIHLFVIIDFSQWDWSMKSTASELLFFVFYFAKGSCEYNCKANMEA